MRQWLNGWNGTGQSPGSAPAGPPGVPGTGDLDLDDDDDDNVKTGIGGTMPGTGARVDDKQSTLSR